MMKACTTALTTAVLATLYVVGPSTTVDAEEPPELAREAATTESEETKATPLTCPPDWESTSKGCRAPRCARGQVRMRDKTHCCWQGQRYSKDKGVCVGAPTKCPAGYRSSKPHQLCVATMDLGAAHEQGIGVKPDRDRADALYSRGFERRCKKGHQPSCHAAALILLDGIVESEDDGRAATLLERACKKGHGASCLVRSSPGRFGSGVARMSDEYEQMRKRGFELLEASCASKNSSACFELGYEYKYAESGRVKDARKAMEFLTRACNLGDAAGCVELGDSYDLGEGVPAERALANVLFDWACAAGRIDVCEFPQYPHSSAKD